MSYHISNLGSYAGSPTDPSAPAYYADMDGFVPQRRDRCADFTHPCGRPYDPDHIGPDDCTWAQWVAAAEIATARAERAASLGECCRVVCAVRYVIKTRDAHGQWRCHASGWDWPEDRQAPAHSKLVAMLCDWLGDNRETTGEWALEAWDADANILIDSALVTLTAVIPQ